MSSESINERVNEFDTINTKLSIALQQLKLDKIEDGEKIAEKIRNCVILNTLELSGNTLGVEATIPIAKALECRPELRHALWSDLFTGRLKTEIPNTLKLLTTAMISCGARLVELDLSDNAIGPMAMPGLQDFLASESACELKVLNFNNCGMGIAGKVIAECLMECHKNSLELGTPLRLIKFIAGRNRLELISTTALAKAFKQIGTLEEIVMPQNGILIEGIIEMAEAIKHSKHLKYLNLNDNCFGEKGAFAMAEAISNLKNLETVDFGDCLCRNKGSVEISECLLKSQTPLKSLNFSGNEIGYDAAKQIIDRIKKIEGFKTLSLNTNGFGSRFELLQGEQERYSFLNIGEESDDEGTIDNENSDENEN